MTKAVVFPFVPLPDAPHPEAIKRTLRATFGSLVESEEAELFQRYNGAPGLRELTQNVNPRCLTIVVLRLGLAGNDPMSRAAVGEKLGLTRERIRQIEAQALAQMRAVEYRREEAAGLKAVGQTPIESLDFTSRVKRCLRRNRIKSVEQLTGKTADELAKMPDIGHQSLQEIVMTLNENGLKLLEARSAP